MGGPDNDASRIYNKRIRWKRRIVLTPEEKQRFAVWLALFWARIPKTYQSVVDWIGEFEEDPRHIKEIIAKNRTGVLSLIREGNPERYTEVVNAMGKSVAETHLLTELFKKYEAGEFSLHLQADNTYHFHLREFASEEVVRHLVQYTWVWLSSDTGFVIGDNPLVRWHDKTRTWDVGIHRHGVEITIPLSKSLCLLIEKPRRRYDGCLVHCNSGRTRELNLRQRFASVNHVYGPKEDLLRF